jgi:hypothetical protein
MADPTYCGNLLWHAIEVAQACGQDPKVTQKEIHEIFRSVLMKGMSLAALKFKFLNMWYGNKDLSGTKRMEYASDVLTQCSLAELGEIQAKLWSYCVRMHKLKVVLVNTNQLPGLQKWQDGWQNLPHPIKCPFCGMRVCGDVVWPKHAMSPQCSEFFMRK